MTTVKDYQVLVTQMKDMDIGMLVINAGFLGYPQDFETFSDLDIERMVSVNALQPVYLIKVLLKQIKSRPGRSAIITTSSVAALRPSPALAVYAATKTFATYLSVALGHELKEKIDFLAISPGPVSTEMTKN